MSNYTQQDFNDAPIMDSKHYMTLDAPEFEGQTRANSNGEYTMYFSNNGQLFGYKHKLGI